MYRNRFLIPEFKSGLLAYAVFFLHKPPLYMYKKSQKFFCTENFFCTFKKGVCWHVKPFKISV